MAVKVFDATRHCGAARRTCDRKLHAADWSHLDGCEQRGEHGHVGAPCLLRKGQRTDHLGSGHCRSHYGTAPGQVKQAANEAAATALAHLGIAITKEPQQALLDAVYEAAGNVAFLRQEVQALGSALVGTVKAAAGGGEHAWLYDASEEERAIVKLYGQWNDRLVKYAKAAIDAGIAERAVRIAEQQADAIVRVVNAALAAVELTAEQRQKAVQAAVTELRTFDAAVPVGAERN